MEQVNPHRLTPGVIMADTDVSKQAELASYLCLPGPRFQGVDGWENPPDCCSGDPLISRNLYINPLSSSLLLLPPMPPPDWSSL